LQPWWDKPDKAFATAYVNAALAAKNEFIAANPGTCLMNALIAQPRAAPEIALILHTSLTKPSQAVPYYEGYFDFGDGVKQNWRRQSGYLAVVQSVPAPGPTSVPGPLPVLGLLVTWKASRKLRKRLNASKASTAHSRSWANRPVQASD
jgi:hypothetical protein